MLLMKKSSLKSSHQKMQDDGDLECPCCITTFVEPIVLPCGHTVCLSCVEDLHSLSVLKNPPEMLSSIDTDKYMPVKRPPQDENVVVVHQDAQEQEQTEKKQEEEEEKQATTARPLLQDLDCGCIACPLCRASCPIPPKGPSAMARNHALRKLCEASIKQKEEGGAKLQCDGCNKKEAEMDCLDCAASMCSSCFDNSHQLLFMKKHRVDQVGAVEAARQKIKGTMCKFHPSEEMKIFCTEDQELLCILCTYDDVHDGHTCKPLAKAAHDALDDIGKLKETANATVDRIKAASNKLRVKLKLVRSSSRKVKDAISASFARVINALQKHRDDLLNDVDNTTSIVANQHTASGTIVNRLTSLLKRMDAAGRLEPVQILALKQEVNRVLAETSTVQEDLYEYEPVDFSIDEHAIIEVASSSLVLKGATFGTAGLQDSAIITTRRLVQALRLVFGGDGNTLSSSFKIKECLFRASEHNFQASGFHQMCNNKGPTITFVRSKEGYIFGGYAFIHFTSNNTYGSDPKAFLFSLVGPQGDCNPIRINCSKHSHALFHQVGYGPTFGNAHDLCIHNNCNTSETSYNTVGHAYTQMVVGENVQLSQYMLAGKHKFLVDEYEVFSVEWAN